MPLIRQEGKDTIIFATKEDHSSPSKVVLPEPEPSPGLLLPNGEINWNCPCLGGMATGPCGLEFREAFSCFHYSNAEPKGSDCYEAFKTMQSCMSHYPALYGNKSSDISDMEDDANNVEEYDTKQSAVETSIDNKREPFATQDSHMEGKTESGIQATSTNKDLERSTAK